MSPTKGLYPIDYTVRGGRPHEYNGLIYLFCRTQSPGTTESIDTSWNACWNAYFRSPILGHNTLFCYPKTKNPKTLITQDSRVALLQFGKFSGRLSSARTNTRLLHQNDIIAGLMMTNY